MLTVPVKLALLKHILDFFFLLTSFFLTFVFKPLIYSAAYLSTIALVISIFVVQRVNFEIQYSLFFTCNFHIQILFFSIWPHLKSSLHILSVAIVCILCTKYVLSNLLSYNICCKYFCLLFSHPLLYAILSTSFVPWLFSPLVLHLQCLL